jgi:predicted dehydrogenase
MSDQVGFVTMGQAKAVEGEIPTVGIGMLGYAFMGKAHVNGYKKIPYIIWPPAAIPNLVAIAGRNQAAVSAAAQRFGFAGYYGDWREMLKDERVQIFDNCGPNNLHAEPTIAAAEAGKAVICEKPLGRTAAEAKSMLDAVNKAGVKNMCAFNYRFVPAVRLVRQMIEQGVLGQIYHFRARYLQEWIMDPNFQMVWRLRKDVAGSGALGDLGSHIIDLARFLVGEPTAVNARLKTFIKDRPTPEGGRAQVDVDDAFISLFEFENGAIGTLEATRFALGRKNANTFEINGSRGSVVFNLEKMNELEVHIPGEQRKEAQGFTNVLVSESFHPFWANWWPQGHIIGWEHTFVHELNHFIEAVVQGKQVGPYGATFEDGYRNAVICDAIVASSANNGASAKIEY